MKCPECGFESPSEMRFCGLCGARLTRVCPACGFANPLNFKYCGMCRQLLDADLEVRDVPEVARPSPAPAGEPLRSEAAPPPTALEGERRVATILMADVQGSTDLLEQVGTETWVKIMNRLFQLLEVEIYRFEGKVDQFRGDGLVAFFGATAAHEDDPERAVLAGLAMQEAVKAYAAELRSREGVDLALRVGINTGEVIVTSVGDRRQYSEETAMGEAITIAARMETSAEPGTVLVSENTYRLIPSQFDWEPLGQVKVKGIRQPIVVYRPLAPRADVEQLQSYGLSIPLVGREQEFDALKAAVEDLYDGRGGIATVMGERGLGKSFLVAEVRRHFARQGALLAQMQDKEASPRPPLLWLRGRARSYDQARPYSMWIDLLYTWLGGRPDRPPEELRESLRYQTERLWNKEMERYYPYLAALLSLPLEAPFAARLQALDAENLHHRFSDTVYAWVKALARQGPLVLYFADMHWADATSLELLKHCLPIADDEALLWLLVFRPDRTLPVWGLRYHVETEYPHRLTAISLRPLNDAESSEIIDHLIGPNVLPPETQELVIEKAEGNPYYIQELIHALMSQEILVQEEGKWRATQKVSSINLPDSIQSLLLARIDRLSAEERRLVQVASVIGTVFWSDVLTALLENGTPVKEHLTALQRRQMIVERGQVPSLGMEYLFKSTLLRDAAYEGLLSEQRRMLHLQVARYFETHFDEEGLVPYHGLLAYHYRRAGDFEQELAYILRAAERARRVYANAEALDHYTHAMELLDRLEAQDMPEAQRKALLKQRFRVLDGRREVRFLLGDVQGAWDDALALLPIGQALEDEPIWLIDALLQQPEVTGWQTKEELREGIAMAEEALRIAREIGDERREMLSLGTLAAQLYNLGDPAWWDCGNRALELARKLDDKRYQVVLLTGLGHIYATQDPERSMEYLREARPICQELDDKQAEIDLLDLIGAQMERSDDYYRRLVECREPQLHLSREVGNRPMEGRALMFAGQLRAIYLGDFKHGLALLREALEIAPGIGLELYILLRIAQVQIMQERYDDAQKTLARARHLTQQPAHGLGLTGYRLVAAMLFTTIGDEQLLRQALTLTAGGPSFENETPSLTRQYQMVLLCARTAVHLGLAACEGVPTAEQREHKALALETSQAALDIYLDMGYVQPIECTSEELFYRRYLALRAHGRLSEAREHLRRAYQEMMRKHNQIPPSSYLRRTYLDNVPLHREIRIAYAGDMMRLHWDGSKINVAFNGEEGE
ncbi:MAG: BREX system ATP-binding domain-containing protein [Anaerolineae bacterium]